MELNSLMQSTLWLTRSYPEQCHGINSALAALLVFLFSFPMMCVFIHLAHHQQNLTSRDKHWAEQSPLSGLNWEVFVSYWDVWVLHPD